MKKDGDDDDKYEKDLRKTSGIKKHTKTLIFTKSKPIGSGNSKSKSKPSRPRKK